jgi:hypothetical protein
VISPPKPTWMALLIWLMIPLPPVMAQFPCSTLSGFVTDKNGNPVPDTWIQWSQNGQLVTLHSDTKGEFSYHFAMPGQVVLKFGHASTAENGSVAVLVRPDRALHVDVRLQAGAWDFVSRWTGLENAWEPELVLTAGQIESMPGTGHLLSLLNDLEASVVSERFDLSGMHSHRQMLIGVRGSSWSQNQFSLNGLSVTHPSGDGMLLFPDETGIETTVYTVGESDAIHAGPGAHIALIPKAGSGEVHGQARIFFQSGALQNTNLSKRHRFFRITESDERWRHFLNGSLEFGGPVGNRPWNYFGAISARDLEKQIRNLPQPVTANLVQGSFHLSGRTSSRDVFHLLGSIHRDNEPEAEASPRIALESTTNRRQKHYAGQSSWTRYISPASSLDLRIGISSAVSKAQIQADAAGQSQEDLFPGYAVAGLADSPSPWDMIAWLSNTRRGPAPLAISWEATSTSGLASYTTMRRGFRHSRHRITAGAGYFRQALEQRQDSVDGVNLLFFEGAPNSVRLLNTPTRTRERIRQLELHAADSFSLARVTLTLGLGAHSSWGKSILSSDQSANALHWNNVAGRLGLAYQLFDRGPLVLRAGVARIFHQPRTSLWAAANPEGLGARLFSWNDANGDRLFQDGENSRMLKVYGAPYARLDPNLSNIYNTEFTAGFSAGGAGGIAFHFLGFHRSEHALISQVNEGVPFSSYTPVQVAYPGFDGEVGTPDDGYVTAFNQKAETLGQDRYVLTNPKGFSAYSQGMEFRLSGSFTRFHAEVSVVRFRAVASTAPGVSPLENDTGAYLGIFDDPNKAILAKGSTYFDRGTLARLRASAALPWKMRASLITAYQDGMPYGCYFPIKGLNQGIIAVLVTQRGPGARGSLSGPRTTYNATLNMRLSRSFSWARGSMTATLDAFNLTNLSNALMETYVTAPTQYWRIPLKFQTPRSLQLGLRYGW